MLRVLFVCAAVVAVAGGVLNDMLGSDGSDRRQEPTAAPRGARLPEASAPVTAATLTQIPNVREARRRLAYVNLDRIEATRLPVPRRRLVQGVLGPGAAEVGRRPHSATAVQVGQTAAVLADSSRTYVVGGAPRLRAALVDRHPETSAITPAAMSAVQSCLGDTVAQTMLGPGTMGRDAALGVGLAESNDPPAGLQLRICGAPRLLRHVDATAGRMRSRFRDLAAGQDGMARIATQEIGEREIIAGVVPVRRLTQRALLGLLSGGPTLRALAWR